MTYLVRKYARAKWKQPGWMQHNAIQADALTGDLRTHQNTLSWWICNQDQSPAKLKREVATKVLPERLRK